MPPLDLTPLGYAFGRLAGAARFASPEIRRVVGLATVAGAWRAYRRDAGAGDVGPAHQPSSDPSSILMTDDPRRDAVVLWLASHGVPAIADAATTVVRMVDATRRFGAEALEVLDVAQEALTQMSAGPFTRACGLADVSPDHPLEPLRQAISAVDALIRRPDFAEGQGHEAELPLPSRSMRHYVSADPAACWALNLALVARGGVPSVTGIIPRTAFRLDLEDVERSTALIDHSNHAALASFMALERIETMLGLGRDALAGLSRNARAADAWALVTAFGPISRTQIARALGLSRAGADIQAHALAAAGLVRLEAGGRLTPTLPRTSLRHPDLLDQGPLSAAAADLDLAMAEIDRLLSDQGAAIDSSPNCERPVEILRQPRRKRSQAA
jgi:hypothetical protein